MNKENVFIRDTTVGILRGFIAEMQSASNRLATMMNMVDFKVECLAVANDLEKMTAATLRVLESAAEGKKYE